MTDESSWHHGSVARWWAEFNTAEPAELDYYRVAVQRYGSPVLDVGCGAGWLLLPLAEAGIAIDGIDAPADMIACARAIADGLGVSPGLLVQTDHALDLPGRYRTALMVGVLGVGVSRSLDQQALARVAGHLCQDGEVFRYRGGHDLEQGGGLGEQGQVAQLFDHEAGGGGEEAHSGGRASFDRGAVAAGARTAAGVM